MKKPVNHWMSLAHPGAQYDSASDGNLMMAATRRSTPDLPWENVIFLIRAASGLPRQNSKRKDNHLTVNA
jgi:hypothetical protein